MHLATPSEFSGMPLKLKETNISNKHDRLKNPNWREADQMAIYKHDRGVELGVYQETTPDYFGDQSGTWPHNLRMSSPAPQPLGLLLHTHSSYSSSLVICKFYDLHEQCFAKSENISFTTAMLRCLSELLAQKLRHSAIYKKETVLNKTFLPTFDWYAYTSTAIINH